MSDRQFVIACVIDSHPRFWVELILWIHCVRRWLPQEQFKPKVYFVGTVPEDLQQWVKALGVDTAQSACQVEGSPHCNKIAPFLDEHDADWIVVTDADLFIVDDLSHFFRHRRLRAAPNNHCNPPAHVFKSVLAASGINKPYRPGTTLYKGAATYVNLASITSAPV